jgi:hypothetical protein
VVNALASYTGGLFAAGNFTNAGGTVVSNIARWGSPVAINQTGNSVPQVYSLSQNYPNPFNPVTNVELKIPEKAFVKLVVFDVLGRETATLVSAELNPGTYEVNWDASIYTSGIYYYRLTAGNFTDTKKMMLVK